MTSGVIDIAPEHRRIVLGVLKEQLPEGARVWVFGSRATGRARRYSDLDLAVDAGRRLTIDETATLREAFEESDLPYVVDIVDWNTVNEGFRKIIEGCRLALVEAL